MKTLSKEKMKFVQTLLQEHGVKPALTTPYPHLLFTFINTSRQPVVFENPIKIFVLQSIFGSFFWGLFMWLCIWQFQESNIANFYFSMVFGVSTGGIQAIQIHRIRKKFKITNLEEWLKNNELD